MSTERRPLWERKIAPPSTQSPEYYELHGSETVGGISSSHGIELITADQANTRNLELWGVGDRRRWRKVSGVAELPNPYPAV